MAVTGIVSKRLGSRYRSGRSPDWLKVKNPAAPAVRREAEEDLGTMTPRSQPGSRNANILPLLDSLGAERPFVAAGGLS